MNKYVSILIIIFVLILSCGNRQSSSETIPSADEKAVSKVTYPITVHLKKALKNVDTSLKLSDFVEEIVYIPIQFTNLDYSHIWKIIYDEDDSLFIIDNGFNASEIIDKKGKLIKKIGHKGQGPGEYIDFSSSSVDTKRNKIYIYSAAGNRFLCYDYQGKLIKIPFKADREHFFTVEVYYNNDNFVGISESYYPFIEGIFSKLYGFSLMDSLGKVKDYTASQAMQLTKEERKKSNGYFSTRVTRYKNHLLLVPTGVADTIFTAEGNRIIPRYFLDYEGEKPSLKGLWSEIKVERKQAQNSCLFIYSPAYETERYFLIKLKKKLKEEYIICYDKYTGEEKSVLYDYYGFDSKLREEYDNLVPSYIFGFSNDIDGGIDVYPFDMSSEGNYWVSYISAELMKQLLTDKYFAGRQQVKDPAAQKRLKKLVSQLNEDDDPVIILMKLKKEAR